MKDELKKWIRGIHPILFSPPLLDKVLREVFHFAHSDTFFNFSLTFSKFASLLSPLPHSIYSLIKKHFESAERIHQSLEDRFIFEHDWLQFLWNSFLGCTTLLMAHWKREWVTGGLSILKIKPIFFYWGNGSLFVYVTLFLSSIHKQERVPKRWCAWNVFGFPAKRYCSCIALSISFLLS